MHTALDAQSSALACQVPKHCAEGQAGAELLVPAAPQGTCGLPVTIAAIVSRSAEACSSSCPFQAGFKATCGTETAVWLKASAATAQQSHSVQNKQSLKVQTACLPSCHFCRLSCQRQQAARRTDRRYYMRHQKPLVHLEGACWHDATLPLVSFCYEQRQYFGLVEHMLVGL